jgi:hypothetical protein
MAWTKNDDLTNHYRYIRYFPVSIDDQYLYRKILDWKGSISYLDSNSSNYRKISEVLRPLYENKKAFFAKVVDPNWYSRKEVHISMDIPFEEGVKSRCVLFYASTKTILEMISEIEKKAYEEGKKRKMKEEEEREKEINSLLDSTKTVQPSAPPREQVEGC